MLHSVYKIDISQSTQKEPWYLEMNPNGRIPVLVDHLRGGFTVFETAAILLYLERYYDRDERFIFNSETQSNEYSTMLQWIFWAVGYLRDAYVETNIDLFCFSMVVWGLCRGSVSFSLVNHTTTFMFRPQLTTSSDLLPLISHMLRNVCLLTA